MDNKGLILDGRYEVIRILGEGGMGKVYLCKNIRLDILVAVKEFKKNGSASFITEPHILKKLKHSGIPHIYDIFEENNYSYMVEEYIEGETLDNYVKKNSLSLDQIICIASELCNIIGYLHSFNPPIIYRDLKPSNIIIKQDGYPSLIDFGISRLYKEDNLEDTIYMGSAGYAAPEQCGNGQSCRQTDVYGLGAVIYFMMNKKAPSNFLEALNFDAYNKSYGDILPRIVIRAMSLDINRRFLTVEDMKQQLHKAKEYDETRLMFHSEIVVNHSGDTKNYSRIVEKNKISRGKRFIILSGLLMVIFAMGIAAIGLSKTFAEERTVVKLDTPDEKIQEIEKVQVKDTEAPPVLIINDRQTDDSKIQRKEDKDESVDKEEKKSPSAKGKAKGKGNKKKK